MDRYKHIIQILIFILMLFAFLICIGCSSTECIEKTYLRLYHRQYDIYYTEYRDGKITKNEFNWLVEDEKEKLLFEMGVR
jgi:hypothetical protein